MSYLPKWNPNAYTNRDWSKKRQVGQCINCKAPFYYLEDTQGRDFWPTCGDGKGPTPKCEQRLIQSWSTGEVVDWDNPAGIGYYNTLLPNENKKT